MNKPTDNDSLISNNTRKQLTERLAYDLPVLRARLGISQEVLADKIGISRQTYNAIETEKKEMSWTVFLALIAVFMSNEETRKMLSGMEDVEGELNC